MTPPPIGGRATAMTPTEDPLEYRAVFEAAPDGIVIVDAGGRVREVNPRAVELFGWSRDELVGQPIEVLVPKDRRPVHRLEREAYVDSPRARPMGMGLDLVGRRKDGSTFPVEISLSPLETSEGLLVISVVRDVSERNRLRNFGVNALRAAEDERQRIARELHDDTAQRLAALLVQLEVVARIEDPRGRARSLEEVRERVKETADSVRRIARALRPPPLEDLGIVAAIRAHARTIGDSHALDVEVAASGHPALEPETELALYRIVQEALANVVRHADAGRARVEIDANDGRVVTTIEDDGRGFRWPEVGDRGLGLIGMEERARRAGGRLSIETSPGEGTRVTVEIPAREAP